MGLDVSHDAFHGAYSAFNRFRQAVAAAAGGSYPPHYLPGEVGTGQYNPDMDQGKWYWGDDHGPESHPGLEVFFNHSDCDGEISPEDCVLVARDLEALLPAIDQMGDGAGHIAYQGGYGAITRKFIAGCRDAAAAGEPLDFH